MTVDRGLWRLLGYLPSSRGSFRFRAQLSCIALKKTSERHAAMGQYIIALAKLAGVKTLNVVRRKEAAEQVRQWGGDRVVLQGDNLHKDIEEALDGKKLSLVLDTLGGTPVGELAKSLKPGGSVVVYGLQSGQFPAMPPKEFIYRGLSRSSSRKSQILRFLMSEARQVLSLQS